MSPMSLLRRTKYSVETAATPGFTKAEEFEGARRAEDALFERARYRSARDSRLSLSTMGTGCGRPLLDAVKMQSRRRSTRRG